MRQYSICLNMIVKDEGSIIEETLANILDNMPISYWIVADTGSTDDTCQRIQAFFDSRGIPGELYHDEWVNFGHNRNLAYQRCQGKADYVFFFDADDRFYGDFQLPDELTADAYFLSIQHGKSDLFLSRPLLVANRSDFRWRGIIHEYFDVNQKETVIVSLNNGSYVVNSGKFGARHAKGDSIESDLTLLETAYHNPDEEELRHHYAFSCGKLNIMAGNKEKGIFWLEKSLALSSSSLETMEIYQILGHLYKEKGEKEKALQFYFEAFEKFPNYLENPYYAIMLLQEMQKYRDAYDLAISLRDLPFPKETVYQGRKDIYDVFFPYELSQLAYRFGNLALSVAFGQKVLQASQAPLSLKTQVIELLFQAIDQLGQFSYRELSQLKKDVVAYLSLTSHPSAEQLLHKIEELHQTKAKRRLLVLHPFMMVGGVETVLKDFLHLLEVYGEYDVELVCADYADSKLYDGLPKTLKVHQLLNKFESQFYIRAHMQASSSHVNEAEQAYYNSWYFGINKELNQRLMTIVREGHYDVIVDFKDSLFSHFYDSIGKLQLPIIYWVHSNDYFDRWRTYRNIYQRIFSHVTSIVSICDDMSQQTNRVLEELGFKGNKPLLKTIYNPVNQEKIDQLLERSLTVEDLTLLQEPFMVAVSRLYEPQKNLLELIDNYALLKERGVTEKLYILGEGPSRLLLEDRIKELGLEKDCLLLGTKFNPYPFIKAARLFLHTARYEGLPTVLIESMICRTPVVAYDCPTGPREILQDGNLGKLIPLHDRECFVSEVLDLLTNPTKVKTLVDKAYLSVERFSLSSFFTAFDDLINHI